MKKVLILTYYWPPSGKASMHWPLGIARHFPENDWEPVVITVEEDKFSHPDESHVAAAKGIRTIRTGTWEPFEVYKRFTGKEKDAPLVASETISDTNKKLSHRISVWVRMNLFVPDARVGWYPHAVKTGKELLKKEKFDAVISIGPPHSTHLAGKKLAGEFKLPFFPVFIDPWVDIVYYRNFKRNSLTLAVDNRLERSVLKASTAAVFVTPAMREDYIKKYSFLKEKSEVLFWGYDEDMFNGVAISNSELKTEVVLHAGNIFDYQDIPGFWKELVSEIKKGRNLKLKFAGTVSPGIMRSLTEAGLLPYTEFKGFLPYGEVVSEIMNADFLFVCATEKRHLPGKLFEYMRSGNPVIAFGDDNNDVAALLEDTGAGKLFSYSGNGAEVLEHPERFRTDIEKARIYDRRNISRQFAEILDKFVKH